MENALIENWLNNFNQFLEKDNQDLTGLFSQRILFTPDENNHIQPALLTLSEQYATKEQVDRMSSVFNAYVQAHPF